jgi:hypothetical protein
VTAECVCCGRRVERADVDANGLCTRCLADGFTVDALDLGRPLTTTERTATMARKIDPADVQIGDYADHVSGDLDPRPVAYVDVRAGAVALRIGDHVTGLLPLTNYTYTREGA